jgi:DNA-binding transcriptional ArsR family regulator
MAQTKQERAAREIVAALDSSFFQALAEPARIQILRVLLLDGASDINSIAAHLPQDRSVLSRHLQTLLANGIVKCKKDGRRRVYSLEGRAFIERLEGMLGSVRRLVSICCPDQLG